MTLQGILSAWRVFMLRCIDALVHQGHREAVLYRSLYQIRQVNPTCCIHHDMPIRVPLAKSKYARVKLSKFAPSGATLILALDLIGLGLTSAFSAN